MPVTYTNEDRSGAGQIAGLLSGIDQEMIKRQERQKKDAMEQIVMYNQYREAGYSPDESRNKTERAFKSLGLFENILRKAPQPMGLPSGEDKYTREARKAKLEESKIRTENRKNIASAHESEAQASWYSDRDTTTSFNDRYTKAQKISLIKDRYIKANYPTMNGMRLPEKQAALEADPKVKKWDQMIESLLAEQGNQIDDLSNMSDEQLRKIARGE